MNLLLRILPLTALLTVPLSAAGLPATVHEYKIGDAVYEGLLVRPLTKMASYPGVLVVHDWMGNNEFSRARAEQLAQLGYIALAVDMYGKGKRATNADEAAQLAGVLYQNPKLFQERILAALAELKKQSGVDATRLGAIGFCFGGTTVMELARSGADIKGVVSFHGAVKPFSTTPPPAIKPHVLILHGTFDPLVPPADVAACLTELNAVRAHYRFVGYPEAVHSFTNPKAGNDNTQPVAYNEAVATAAYGEMETFFKELFAR